MLYVLSTFMLVFAGREITMNKSSRIIVASFIMQFFAYISTVVASHPDTLEWLEKIVGWQ
jgi:hypothetical protein